MFTTVVGAEKVPADPWEQLRAAIEAVFRSWNSERAQAYRAVEGIPDDLGTAVTVQAMVFGNRGDRSGTGVLFTRDPSTGDPTLFGDVMFGAQGEDVVAGTHQTEPVTVLDERAPAVAADLWRYAGILEHHYADMCDIEFTIEDGTLWMLQVRPGKRSPHAALRMAVDMAEDPDFPLGPRAGRAPGAAAPRPPAHDLDRPPRRRRAAHPGARGLTRSGHRRDRHVPGGGDAAGGRRPPGDPGPRRDLARGRAGDGQGGRRAHLPRRARQPRRRRRPRLGHPRRRGGVGGAHRGRRRRHRRTPGTPSARSSRSTARPARCSPGRWPAPRWWRRRPRPCWRGPPSSASPCPTTTRPRPAPPPRPRPSPARSPTTTCSAGCSSRRSPPPTPSPPACSPPRTSCSRWSPGSRSRASWAASPAR